MPDFKNKFKIDQNTITYPEHATLQDLLDYLEYNDHGSNIDIRQDGIIRKLGCIENGQYLGLPQALDCQIKDIKNDSGQVTVFLKDDSLRLPKPMLYYQVTTSSYGAKGKYIMAIAERVYFREHKALPTHDNIYFSKDLDAPYSYYLEIQDALSEYGAFIDGILELHGPPDQVLCLLKQYGFETYMAPDILYHPKYDTQDLNALERIDLCEYNKTKTFAEVNHRQYPSYDMQDLRRSLSDKGIFYLTDILAWYPHPDYKTRSILVIQIQKHIVYIEYSHNMIKNTKVKNKIPYNITLKEYVCRHDPIINETIVKRRNTQFLNQAAGRIPDKASIDQQEFKNVLFECIDALKDIDHKNKR